MIRFHAVNRSRRSAEWSLVAQGSDVYLSPRGLMGSAKVSLHSSGHSHHALTTSAAAEIGAISNPRLDQWWMERPDANQATPGYFVGFHDSQLVTWDSPPHPESRPIQVPDGHVTFVTIWIVRIEGERDDSARTEHFVGLCDLSDGSAVMALTHAEPEDINDLASLLGGLDPESAQPGPFESGQALVGWVFVEAEGHVRGAHEVRVDSLEAEG